jgi:hypothetical protein
VRKSPRLVQPDVGDFAQVDGDQICGRFRSCTSKHRRHHGVGAQLLVPQGCRLLSQRGDLGGGPGDLERDLDRPGLSAGDAVPRPDRFDIVEVRQRVLLDELLALQPEPLGAPVHLGRLRPLLARKLGHLLQESGRGCDDSRRRGSARGRRRG